MYFGALPFTLATACYNLHLEWFEGIQKLDAGDYLHRVMACNSCHKSIQSLTTVNNHEYYENLLFATKLRSENMTATNNPVVVVAGGSRGLGLRIADGFGKANSAKVVVLARDKQRLAAAVEELKESLAGIVDQDPLGYDVDATDESAVTQVVQTIVKQHGRIDVWVNAVGKSTRVDFM